MQYQIQRFDSIDSTNSEALRQAKLGAAEGLCVVASEQTAGRGRQGREWMSSKNSGLYASILLRPHLEPRFLPLISLMTAVAVFDTLVEAYDLRPDIKWPNDILVGEKKICGILAETTETKAGIAVVVGIGINLTSSNFPPTLAASATSVASESGQRPDPDELLRTLTRLFDRQYSILQTNSAPEAVIKECKTRSSYFSGKEVVVTLVGDTFSGITDGLEEDGALRVRTEDGKVRVIHAGDVERVRHI